MCVCVCGYGYDNLCVRMRIRARIAYVRARNGEHVGGGLLRVRTRGGVHASTHLRGCVHVCTGTCMRTPVHMHGCMRTRRHAHAGVRLCSVVINIMKFYCHDQDLNPDRCSENQSC